MPVHSFDEAIALLPLGGDRFAGNGSSAYANMVGAFGGVSAATLLNAVMQHPDRLGEPVSLTVNYAAGFADAPFTVTARAARTNRSTQHWMVELVQPTQAGGEETVLTATAMTAVRRAQWGDASDTPMPEVPAASRAVPLEGFTRMEWLNRYAIRTVHGAMPKEWNGTPHPQGSTLTQLWIRDEPPRPLDFCALAAYADVFFPRIFLRRTTRVPVGTVSMTVYFHADTAMLQANGDAPVLGQARGQVFHGGFFDHSAQLWSQSGTPLVTTTQIVYYKE